MLRLAQSVLECIRKHDLLRAGDRVGVAVSAGGDSVALLRLLVELHSELGIVLSVVHFNHKLRGVESDDDEQFVRELALRHDLPFFSESGDAKAHAEEKKLSLETAARELRYAFFQRVMARAHIDKVATAHTLDDQAETVLLKLARGAGTRGLAGIYPEVIPQPSALSHQDAEEKLTHDSKGWRIVRPLLRTERGALQKYLREIEQPWREDSSNRDLRHTRNRIRHEILPLMEESLNPNLRATLAEVAEIARAEEEYWTREMELLLPQAWAAQPTAGVLKLEFVRDQPLAVQRRLVRAALGSLGQSLEFQHVEEILALDREGARADLPGGWLATLSKTDVIVGRDCRRSLPYAYALKVPDKVAVQEAALVIETEIVRTKDAPDAVLRAEISKRNLVVRNWRHGERFWPAHSKAPKKIKELLQDRHITGDKKKFWPVIASGDEIVWLHDFGVRRDLQATNGSGILIRAVPLNS